MLFKKKLIPFLISDGCFVSKFKLWAVKGIADRAEQSCFCKRVFSFWKAVLCALRLERLSPTFLWRSSDFITPGMKTSFIPNWSNQSICHIITYLAASWPPDQPWDYLPDKIECFGWMLCYLISFRLRSFLCDCSEFITSGKLQTGLVCDAENFIRFISRRPSPYHFGSKWACLFLFLKRFCSSKHLTYFPYLKWAY